jgi:hypothetical protein
MQRMAVATRGSNIVSEIASKHAKPEHAVGAEPTSDCRIGGELDNADAHQPKRPPAKTNSHGAAIEKGHSPSPQPCDGNDPTTNQDCIDFLRDFVGERPWTLVAVRKGPKDVQAETFLPAADRDESAAGWVLKWNARGYDIYFAVNPLKRPMSKKAAKADVAFAAWLWVDLDPLEGADLDLEREEMLALVTDRLPQGLPEPTWIIDSGRGYWAFWKLRTPQPVDGAGPQTLHVEDHGRGIEKAFPGRADHCRNIERIARLPGTINQKTRRRACVIEYRPDKVHELTDFRRVESATGKSTAANSNPKNKVIGELSRYRPAGVDVDKLPVPETIKEMIRTGKHPRDPGGYKTRSEGVLAVLLAMAGEGCDDATMTGVMLAPELPIGAHIRDQADPDKYLERRIRKARLYANNSTRRPAAGPSYEHKQMLLGMQRKELRLLHWMRQLNWPFEAWATEKGIDIGHLYDPVELGVLVQFTVEEDGRFATDPMGRREKRYRRKGRVVVSRAARFPTRLMPAGFTKKQTVERRKKFSRPKRTAVERSRRAENRAAKLAMVQKAANLTCRKSAIFTVLSHNKWMTLRELMAVLIGSPPFLTTDGQALTGNSLRKAIARELDKPDLNSMIEMMETIQKNRLPEKRFRRRPPGVG